MNNLTTKETVIKKYKKARQSFFISIGEMVIGVILPFPLFFVRSIDVGGFSQLLGFVGLLLLLVGAYTFGGSIAIIRLVSRWREKVRKSDRAADDFGISVESFAELVGLQAANQVKFNVKPEPILK